MKTRRGIWIRLDGARVRFILNRKKGLIVRRHGHPEKIVSFQSAYDHAVGQPQLPII